MPKEILWAVAGSGAVALIATAVQAWRYRWSIAGALDRLRRWWLYDWWNYDRKWRNGPSRRERAVSSRVKVTRRAAEVMREALANGLATGDEAPDRTLRLWAEPRGDFHLVLDQVREGDQVVESGGREILAIAPDLAEVFGEISIDWRESHEGAGFVISARR